ncbi:MAG: hypothetical protein M3131_10440, partial [Actinomycetota bacterium]|nr:hypothetical protein [Actinomycetota bacterium]
MRRPGSSAPAAGARGAWRPPVLDWHARSRRSEALDGPSELEVAAADSPARRLLAAAVPASGRSRELAIRVL